MYSLAINSVGHIFVGAVDGWVFRSTDNGGTWIEVNNGLPRGEIKFLGINERGYVFISTGGVFRQ